MTTRFPVTLVEGPFFPSAGVSLTDVLSIDCSFLSRCAILSSDKYWRVCTYSAALFPCLLNVHSRSATAMSSPGMALFSVLVTIISSTGAQSCRCAHCLGVLQELYNDTNGARWLQPWNMSAEGAPCSLTGVTCSKDGDIT